MVSKHHWIGSSHSGSMVTKPTFIHEDLGSIPGLAQWVKDPVLLWLWCRLAAVALIGPLVCELPYASGSSLKKKKKKKKERKKEKKKKNPIIWIFVEMTNSPCCGGKGSSERKKNYHAFSAHSPRAHRPAVLILFPPPSALRKKQDNTIHRNFSMTLKNIMKAAIQLVS